MMDGTTSLVTVSLLVSYGQISVSSLVTEHHFVLIPTSPTVKSVNGGAEHSFKGALLGFAFGCAASILKKSHMSDWTLYPEQAMFGSVIRNGPFGGDHWGDMRIPWLTWEDPGRRPQS